MVNFGVKLLALAFVTGFTSCALGAGVAQESTAVANCTSLNQFLDPATLMCISCGTNERVAASGDRCECDDGAALSSDVRDYRGAVDITCTPCASGSMVAFDGLSCVQCENADCTCPVDSDIQRTRSSLGALVNSSCSTCEAGFGVGDGGNESCVPCILSTMEAGCASCPSGTTLRGLACLPNAAELPAASSYEVVFSDLGRTVTSTLFLDLLPAAYYYCAQGGNRTACQVLANLCVLQLFADVADSIGACRYYNELVELESTDTNGFDGWPARLPWLYYTANSKPQFASDLNLKVTFDHSRERSGSTVGRLQFVAAVYTLRGDFVSIINVTSEWQLCWPLDPRNAKAWTWFGTSLDRACELQINTLALLDSSLSSSEPYFYEPYLVDFEDDTQSLYPLPVSFSGDEGPFYRRFFLYDNVTGNGEAVRIASKVMVRVTLRSNEDGKIYPPLIVVSHKDVDGTVTQQGVRVEFEVDYTSDNADFDEQFTAVICVFAAIATALAYIRVRAHRERNRAEVDMMTFVSMAYAFGDLFSTALYFILCGTSLYYIIFGGTTDNAFVTPPDEDGDDLFENMLIVAASLKILQVVFLVWEQCNYDVFFIDWEKPREHTEKDGTVSVWRTLFLANEFNELQTYRKISVEFLLLSVLFFYSVAGADQLAKDTPDSEQHDYESDDNKLLRFGVAALLFNTLGLGMWLYYKLVHKRFFEDKFGMLQDLASMANISMLVLTHRCRGFYLHGRSVHGRSEVDARLMKEQLQREGEELTGRRGLVENTDDQIFEIYIPETFRVKYDNLLALVTEPTGDSSIVRNPSADADTLATYMELNQFFMAFLTHSFHNEVDFTVKEKTMISRWLRITPDFDTTGIFFPDRVGIMWEIMFMGHEGSLFIFEFFIFTLTDWYTSSFVGALVATYCSYRVIKFMRESFGEANLSRKTLIDRCFLF